MKKRFTAYFLVALLVFPVVRVFSQDAVQAEEKAPGASVGLGADLVSRYIWRGKDYGNSPAIQPTFSVSVAGFKAGVWGCYAFGQSSKKINDTTTVNMGHYAEFDLYVSYTFKWFTLQVTDYFFPNSLSPNDGNKYYNYKNATTGHTFEGSLMFAGPEKFPLQLSVNTLFYGADKNKDSLGVYGMGSDNNFSTYIEAAWIFKVKKIGVDLKPFIGGIPFGSGWYGQDAGIVNLGMTASKAIAITDRYSLPVYVSVITNPKDESVFFVFGLTL
jgi:hypothetical protein